VELRLLRENGTLASPGGNRAAQITASAQLSTFISEFFVGYFSGNPGDFTGSVVITALSGKIAAVGIEFEDGSKITTLPVTPVDFVEP
jgi:hypothetical protein